MVTLTLMTAVTLYAKTINFTGDITGQIIEQESNIPVAFAEITLVNGTEKITLTANEYGYYSAKHIAAGKYELHVVFNNRSFIMSNVKVRDSYTACVNCAVSSANNLPSTVQVTDGKVKVARPSSETSQGEVVKYGTVIQDGQIMIIRNKPITLYA